MKINSINNTYNVKNNNIQSFKRTAVPYPEYASAYVFTRETGIVDSLISKVSKLFSPEVSKESAKIKNQIDTLYNVNLENPKKALLTVLA
jgi:hypothetical protein